jgi:hypothetical protein
VADLALSLHCADWALIETWTPSRIDALVRVAQRQAEAAGKPPTTSNDPPPMNEADFMRMMGGEALKAAHL